LDWASILANVTGAVDQEILARKEYLAAENRILKAQLNGRAERNHQQEGYVLLFPRNTGRYREGPVQRRERLGGILRYYRRAAA
jgi:putative transposase